MNAIRGGGPTGGHLVEPGGTSRRSSGDPLAAVSRCPGEGD